MFRSNEFLDRLDSIDYAKTLRVDPSAGAAIVAVMQLGDPYSGSLMKPGFMKPDHLGGGFVRGPGGESAMQK